MSFVEKAVSRLKQRERVAERNKPIDSVARPATGSGVEAPAAGTGETGVAGMTITVDHDALVRAGYIATEKFERRLAEEFRHIKRPLLEAAFGKKGKKGEKVDNGNLVMVASALPGEGKTHTCINLSLSMAMEKERTVLLVDADVANPTVSRTFGLADAPGLLDVLEGDVKSVADVLVRTNLPRLRLLPAGRPRDNATELLASDHTQAIVDELQSRYRDRIILFDSPPLLATSEALVLANVVGQVAMVVAANTTPRMVVKDAISLLDPEQAVSLILNKSQVAVGGKYGNYGAYGVYGRSEKGGYDDTAI